MTLVFYPGGQRGVAHYFQKGHFNAQFRQKGQKRAMNTWFWEKHVIASEAVVGKT